LDRQTDIHTDVTHRQTDGQYHCVTRPSLDRERERERERGEAYNDETSHCSYTHHDIELKLTLFTLINKLNKQFALQTSALQTFMSETNVTN